MTTTTTEPAKSAQETQQDRLVLAILTAYAATQTGELPKREWTKYSLLALAQARTAIFARADVAMARQRNAKPVGLTPRDQITQDAKSLETVTEDPETAEMRIERFLRATTDEAEIDALLEAAEAHGATRWKWRRSGTDTCYPCRTRARYEAPQPISTPFEPEHPGCDCYPEIFWDNDPDESEEDNNDDDPNFD